MLDETKEDLKEAEEKMEKTEEISSEDLMSMWDEALKEAKKESSSSQPAKSEELTMEKTEEISSKDLMSMWDEALKEAKKESPPSQPAKLEELTPEQKSKVYPELDFILDIPLEISAEIGRTKMLIRDLLKLNQGSIIELEKFAGEPVEIYVNGKLMARGEVVVVNEKFGVRITEIISAQERIKKLGS